MCHDAVYLLLLFPHHPRRHPEKYTNLQVDKKFRSETIDEPSLTQHWVSISYLFGLVKLTPRHHMIDSRCIKASFHIPENRLNFPTTMGFGTKIPMKLVYQYMAIFFNFSPTSNNLHPLQVENCDSNSRLVLDEGDNGKFRLERVNKWIYKWACGAGRFNPFSAGTVVIHQNLTSVDVRFFWRL